MNTIDKILLILFVYVVIFTAAVFIIFWHTGAEPTMLVGGTVAALVAEILSLCRIKTGKDKLNTGEQKETKNEETC